jgi:hypothetical protein
MNPDPDPDATSRMIFPYPDPSLQVFPLDPFVEVGQVKNEKYYVFTIHGGLHQDF